MKKYFITSDIHSFFSIFKEALDKAGWEQNNPDHILVLAGDLFDRGMESIKLLNFVQDLGDRFIFVRGNHEDLLEDCLYEANVGMRIGSHHYSNGTTNTIAQFSGVNLYNGFYSLLCTDEDKQKIRDVMNPIVDWIRKKAVDYVEIGDYIIVHGWIPIIPTSTNIYGQPTGYAFDDNWNIKPTDSTADMIKYADKWNRARWLNGMDCWNQGIRIPRKTIVCGHWHCSWGWSHLKQKYKEFPDRSKKDFSKSFQPFIDEGIIALDACTAYSGLCNVITIEA